MNTADASVRLSKSAQEAVPRSGRERPPLTKVFALLAPRFDVSVDRFHEHWSTTHREHALKIDRIRRYTQAHRLRTPDRGAAPMAAGLRDAEWEGTPEVWFDSVGSALGQRTDPQYVDHAKPDELRFVDVPAIRRVVTRWHLALDPGGFSLGPSAGGPTGRHAGTGPPAVKLMVFGGAPREGDAWNVLAAGLGDACPAIAGIALAHAVQVPGSPPPFLTVVELWWPDLATYRAAWSRDGGAVLAVLTGAVDLADARAFLCEELRVR